MSTDTQDPGLTAYQRGDYAAALTEWQQLASEGNVQACHNLAILYANGQGVPQDPAQAEAWCRKAADQGDASAQEHLADMLAAKGEAAEAVQWCSKAAEQGHLDAQNRLGLFYHLGEGVAQDNETAADWFEAAAMHGHAGAQFNFGVLYANGQRFDHARFWWEKAAAQGYEAAREALAQLAEMGR